MANLQDNIRVSTQVDMQQLDELILKYKDLKVNVSTVAAAARTVSEQIKLSALEQANATKQVTLELQKEREATKLSVEQQKLYNQELRNKKLETDKATQSSNSLFQSLNSLTKIRSELITLFGAYSIGSFAQQMVEAQSKVESFQLGMKNLLGEKFGARLTEDLKKFTVETPLNFENVIDYTNKLVGAFKATGASSREISEQVTPILESLGNTAAALGGGDRLGRLIYAFTQVQATGRLMGTEVRQITETGFPLLAVMAQQTGKSVQELQKDISNGKVSFEQFQKAILSAGKEGGVFAGAMDIMANTVQGRIDKMKETVFFALANIGKQFNESAKDAVNFASSVIDSLFGTENATKRTIEVISTAIKTWVAYNVITKLVAAQSAILNTIERAGLILRGEMVLANIALTGSTEAFTFAQLRAAAAARTFNTVAASNPLGLVVLAIGAATAAYQIYSSSVEEANQFTYDSIKATDSDVKALMTKQSQLNATAKSALSLAEGTEGYRLQVGQLIKKYPEYFGNLDAERASHEDIRRALFFANNEMERKIKLMVQEKLAEKLADRSADLKIQIAQEEIAAQAIIDKRREYQQKQLELKKKGLQDEYQEQLGAYQTTVTSLDQSNKKLADLRSKDAMNQKLQQKATNDLLSSQQEDYQVRRNAIITKWNNKEFETRKQFTDAITALDLEFGYGSTKRAEGSAKAGKEAAEKALKYQEDTDKQRLILKEANALREQQQTRESEQKILDLERDYAELRVSNAKGSESQKRKALTEITKKYREDSANLTRIWDKKDLEASKKFWEELKKEEEKSQEARVKFSEAIDKADQKRKEDLLENEFKREKEAGEKKLKKQKEESEFRTRVQLQELELQKDLADVETKRYDKILDLISGAASETKELFNLNDALRKSKDAREDLIAKQSLLLDITMKGNLFTKEGVKVQKEVDEAKIKSIESSNALALTSYQLLYKAIEMVFNGIKNSIANSMKLAADSYRQSNEIFQEFVVKKREADLKNYENDLETRLRLAEGNFDMQLKLLDEYLSKAEQLMDERGIIDKFASDLEYLNTLGAEKNEQAAKMLEELSLNPLNNIKSMFTNTLNAIGRASDGLSKEQEKIYRQTISNSQNVVDKLEWQRDNTVEILDQMADAYRDKYEEQTRIIKDETDKQIDIVNNALDANLDKLSSFYDSQGDIIRTKYGDILDNNVRYTDTAFEKQLAIWNSARSEQETILISQRDAENQILKTKYEEGKITLDEYLASVASVNQKYGEALVTERTKFYDDLQDKADTYYTDEKAALDKSLADGLISREEYDVKLQTLDDIQKQRSKDIKSIVTKDRDDELAYLKTFYYDAKVLEEQKTADAILKINTEASTKLAGLSSGLATTIAGIEKQKRDTILSYNSQIFEENRKLALAEAELSKAQGKAAAWRNPFTAKATIRNIEDAFNEIISQILAAVNPFAAQRLNDNVIDNQTPVITDGNIFFEKGTDNTSISLKGKPVVDNKGGKIAVLHEEEAVFSKANMSEMTKALGYRPSRDEVIEKFKMGLVNMKLSHSPYVIPKLEAKGIGNVDKLGDKIDSLVREVMKKQTPQIIMNERGIKTYLLGVNSKIEAKMNRFK